MLFLSSDGDAVWEWEKTAHRPLPPGFLLQCAVLESDMGIDETDGATVHAL